MNSDFTLAVHALVFLNHKAEVLSSETLAQNICTNPARVRRVMSRLAKAGLVETREGRKEGGYQFSLCPSQVNLRLEKRRPSYGLSGCVRNGHGDGSLIRESGRSLQGLFK